MYERFFFSSHSLERLAEELYVQLSNDRISLFSRPLIAIPPGMKEWLQMELCRREGNRAILGLEFVSWEAALAKLAGPLPIPTRATLLAAIWQRGDKKNLDFALHMATLFEEYTRSGFPKETPEEALWQKKLFDDIFQAHSWMTLPEALSQRSPREIGPLYLFGIDHLPRAAHQFFLRYRQLNVFRFSPTSMFWEDLRFSDTTYPLLSNWGSLGRKMLADASEFPSQEEENYDLEQETGSNLERLKLGFLLLETQNFLPECPSIQCLQTGSSRLQEVQALRQTILALAEEIPLSEMRVYAPDIAPYAPLIEFCFKGEIPFRIKGIDLARQSPFYQAIVHLFQCVEGRWEKEKILTLFETSAFYRKANWQKEDVEKFREWICRLGVRWGLDLTHRRETAEVEGAVQEDGSWKTGFDSLLDSWIFLQPEKEKTPGWSEVEAFQSFHEKFETLRQTLLSWKQERALNEWADAIEAFIRSTLFVDASVETVAADRFFSQFLESIRIVAKEFPSELFPFSFVESYFSTFSSAEEGASLHHDVRFASVESGSLLPARALFLLGMDEEQFPRNSLNSSLRLTKELPSAQERDRYLFLQAVFAAKERLIFSYSDQSKEDGKSVNPSLLIQELFYSIGPHFKKRSIQIAAKKSSFLTHLKEIPPLPSIPATLSIQELTRFYKNPFLYYLKSVGLSLKEEPDSNWGDFQLSGLDRYWALRSSLTGDPEVSLPSGLFGEAARVNLELGIEEFKESLAQWGIASSSIQTVSLKETETPIELRVQGQPVLLVGEVPLTVPSGVLHMGRDEIGALLRRWPEILSALIANGGHRIYSLKTGKIREVADPREALQRAIELYLRCQNCLFFLHPEWADEVLRKQKIPEEHQDPVVRWAMRRSPDFSIQKEYELWKETLTQTFSPLTALFERRDRGEV